MTQIISEESTYRTSKLARVVGDVEAHVWDAVVPVRDTRLALAPESKARRADRERDRLCRVVITELREVMTSDASEFQIRSTLREVMPLLERCDVLDRAIDLVAFSLAPVELKRGNEALLIAISRCEEVLSPCS